MENYKYYKAKFYINNNIVYIQSIIAQDVESALEIAKNCTDLKYDKVECKIDLEQAVRIFNFNSLIR